MHTNFANELDDAIVGFTPIDLKDMDCASKLMDRWDTKYVFCATLLPQILEQAQQNYTILEINGERKQDYETLYFDTLDYDMYCTHHNSRPRRFKVRIRKYVQSDLLYLEIKDKNKKGQTSKKRIKFQSIDDLSLPNTDIFLRRFSPYNTSQIGGILINRFTRLTLVGINSPERVTLDLNLTFSSRISPSELSIPNICVAELKRDKSADGSVMASILKQMRIAPMGFSKYCMGLAMMHTSVKTNAFKQRILRVLKINANT